MRFTGQVASDQVVTATTTIDLAEAPAWARERTVYINASAVSGTSPSLTATIQHSPDSATWFNGAAGAALAAAGVQRITETANVGRFGRLSLAVTGTTPSFTLSVWVEYRG